MANAVVTSSVGVCPAKYKDTLFLTPQDIKDIMGIGENSVYKYLQTTHDFKVQRIGKLFRVNARSFWSWYNEA